MNKVIGIGAKVADEVAMLFAGELNPVAPKTQKKVPVAKGKVKGIKLSIDIEECLIV